MKKILIIAAVLIAVFVVPVMLLGRFVFPNNVSETTANNEDAELKTRIYDADMQTIFEAVKQIVPTLTTYGSNWKLTNSMIKNEQSEVTVEVPVIFFTDDLKISLHKNGDGTTTVDVHSNSRVGKSDFGENRRHVLQILNKLDERFAAGK